MFNVLLSAGVLLGSLQSLYISGLGISVFSVFGGLLIIFCGFYKISKSSSLKNGQFFVYKFYLILFAWSALSFLLSDNSADFKRFIGFLFGICLAAFAPFAFRSIHKVNLIKTYLCFHFSFFYVQFIGFYLFGVDIDFIYYVTGSSQKGWGGSFEHILFSDFRRLGGLYNEPGTYSTFVAPILALFSIYSKISKINLIIFTLSLLSLFLTFSTYGFIFGLIIIAYMMHVYKSSFRIYIISLALFSIGLVFPFLYDRFVFRAQRGQDSGIEFRVAFILEIYNYLTDDFKNLLFGAGGLNIDLDSKINIVAAVNDASMFLYLILVCGPIIGLALLAALVAKAKAIKNGSLVALFILLLSKTSLFWVFTPIIMILIFGRYSTFIAPSDRSLSSIGFREDRYKI